MGLLTFATSMSLLYSVLPVTNQVKEWYQSSPNFQD